MRHVRIIVPERPGGTISSMDSPRATAAERSSIDDVVELYKKDVDRTLLREALRLTPSERIREMEELSRFAEELSKSGRESFR
jgi:hypothetical protein